MAEELELHVAHERITFFDAIRHTFKLNYNKRCFVLFFDGFSECLDNFWQEIPEFFTICFSAAQRKSKTTAGTLANLLVFRLAKTSYSLREKRKDVKQKQKRKETNTKSLSYQLLLLVYFKDIIDVW